MNRFTFVMIAFLLFAATGTIDNYWLQFGGCSLFAVSILVLLAGGRRSTSRTERTKTGYLIRANERNKVYGNGYPIYVDGNAVRKALLTGEYTFTEDDTREIPEDIQYRDERLN